MISERLKELVMNCYPRWSPTMYKATLVSILALAFIIPLVLVGLPFIEFLNGMAAQPKAKTQMTYGRVYGKELLVDRLPVEDTVHTDYERPFFDEYGNNIEDAKKVGEKLNNPLPVTMENLKAGQKRFDVFCIVCHGQRGEGDGSVTGPDRYPAPPSLHTEQARQYKDGTIYHIITKGLGQMPSYADKLEPTERWQTVQYVRALQRAMNPKPEDLAK